MVAAYRVLGIAAATGRIGYALLSDGDLVDWGMSRPASLSPELSAAQTKEWLTMFQPEVVVTEKLSASCRKRGRTLALIPAISQAASEAGALSVSVERIQGYKDKYAEAQALARLFPALSNQIPPKPPIWLPEPRPMIIFEALALALSVRQPEDI